jgi:FtsP/CotA-like multicopper oxidase with cupredoxin domain
MPQPRLAAFVAVALLAPVAAISSAQEEARIGWDAGLSLPTAPDLNPDPGIVEINLDARVAQVEIAPGRMVEAWTYNGGLPGPLIRVTVGNRLIVHFTNHLPAPTTVHWHGLRVPVEMDGVPGFSQAEVMPGGEFTYDFIVPDAGLFWYHPHVMSAAQVGFGLYGAFLVDDPDDGIAVPEEHVLVLSDIDVTAAGQLEDPETGGSAGMAFGREGNVLLVNGHNHPKATIRTGVLQRWRVANVSKSRYFELDAGPGNTFTRIGGDGGLMAHPVETNTLVLAAGERADVFITPRAAPDTELRVMARLFDRGYGSTEARQDEALFTLVMNDRPAPPAMPVPKTSRVIAPIPQAGATAVPINFGITQSPQGRFEYTLNGKTFGEALPIDARVGETQIWTITNDTPWSHPVHLHGFFFQVLDTNGEPVQPLEWKDTVSVPYKKTLKLIVRFEDRPGMWMYHCHILDHAEGGLMSAVRLTRPGEALPEMGHMQH